MKYSAIDTMTADLVKATLDESLESAYLKMKNKKIRHLPVVDGNNKIVGILSDRDLCRAMQTDLRDWQSFNATLGQIEEYEFDPKDKVKDFMSWPVKTVAHDTDLRLVIRRMVQEKVSAFLVTHERHILGIVTSEDLLKLLYDLLEDKFFETQSPVKERSWIGTLLRVAK